MTAAPPELDALRANPDWERLPLFDRAGWSPVRFGDVVTQLKEKVDPVKEGVERYVAGEHMETENVHIRKWGNVGDGLESNMPVGLNHQLVGIPDGLGAQSGLTLGQLSI